MAVPSECNISEIYDPDDFVSRLDPFEVAVCREFLSLPEIRYLDDYMHLEEQLRNMRDQNDGRFILERFSLEFALLMRLNEYDEKVGLPLLEMPPLLKDKSAH